ncbi:hypothetical protein BB427_22450 [Pseudoalteromonas sp. BMB]|uniref:hypothetical protein n=1 Tax=Pseudoalteromonas sp. BMB TaxID=1874619 RepID=UPI00083D8A8E|nr:hypothetical protein [Pseudoalteromonas sp. BMB]ODB33446.1 hypothetical protein BB427_22450 [Pseudoalteromonas sp. BMB]
MFSKINSTTMKSLFIGTVFFILWVPAKASEQPYYSNGTNTTGTPNGEIITPSCPNFPKCWPEDNSTEE